MMSVLTVGAVARWRWVPVYGFTTAVSWMNFAIYSA